MMPQHRDLLGKGNGGLEENITFHDRVYGIAKDPVAELILRERTRFVRGAADSLSG
jgi:hypothetical protein